MVDRHVVCSIHFKKSDYERDLKAELMPGASFRARLNPDAIPGTYCSTLILGYKGHKESA